MNRKLAVFSIILAVIFVMTGCGSVANNGDVVVVESQPLEIQSPETFVGYTPTALAVNSSQQYDDEWDDDCDDIDDCWDECSYEWIDGDTQYLSLAYPVDSETESLLDVRTLSVQSTSIGNTNALTLDDFINDTDAQAIALSFTGNGQVTSCKLVYNGVARYEVAVTTDTYVFVIYINAYTGDIEEFTRDSVIQTPPTPSQTTPQQPPVTPQSPAVIPPQQTVITGSLSAEQARGIAMDFLGRGTIVRHETKSNYIKVCIQIDNEHHDVKINYNGTIREHKIRAITLVGSKAWGYDQSGIISFDRAAAIAIERVGGGVIIENKLDYKKNVGLVYKVKVVIDQTEYKVELHASDGTIYKYESKYKP